HRRGAGDGLLRDTARGGVRGGGRAPDALVVGAPERGGAPGRQRDSLRLPPGLLSVPPAPPQELRSSLVQPPTDDERPALLANPGELLQLPELRSWWPRPEAAAPFIEEIAAVRDSPLVLGRLQQEERLAGVLPPPAP